MADRDRRRGKSNDATVKLRVSIILQLLINGAQRHEILQYAANPASDWGLKNRQIDEYIAKARKEIERLARDRRRKALARQLVQRANIYARAIKEGELRTALSVLDSEVELLGLETPIQRQIRQLQQQLADLERKLNPEPAAPGETL